MEIKSEFTKKTYNIDNVVRIVNMTQLAAYMANGVELLDIYVSRDRETKMPILVGVVDRKQSYESYDKWCKKVLIEELNKNEQ